MEDIFCDVIILKSDLDRVVGIAELIACLSPSHSSHFRWGKPLLESPSCLCHTLLSFEFFVKTSLVTMAVSVYNSSVKFMFCWLWVLSGNFTYLHSIRIKCSICENPNSWATWKSRHLQGCLLLFSWASNCTLTAASCCLNVKLADLTV